MNYYQIKAARKFPVSLNFIYGKNLVNQNQKYIAPQLTWF
jgi:hypothetical protein